ncbi:beta-N-acetylhexosaminidase [Sphingosinicella sp.]|uniref:beta-N-acetylhexosaminidase n=1 Tax=Sphingosinicella sp. TaxID=1917971 RepID=UPI004038113A
MLSAIFSLSGPALTDAEQTLFGGADPAGYALFARNCVDRAQLRALTDTLRDLSGRADVPILIDQEGGRVARMKPPEWPAFPAGEAFAALYEKAPISAIEAARVNGTALGLILAEVGVNVDCLPLLDVRQPGANDVIGDRALGDEPMKVAALGRAMLDGLGAGGCVGVIKHMPGHGRAMADSHKELPVVDATDEELEIDVAPFRALNDAPMAMTAHVLYRCWDAERPASISPTIIAGIIRDRISFGGLLMSDDIGMEALSGTPVERARAVIDAGCDLALHCSGKLDEMEAIAGALPPLTDKGAERLAQAMAGAGQGGADDLAALIDKRDALLAYA